MTMLAKEIPFPMPHGRREADARGMDQQVLTDHESSRRSTNPIGPEEKARHRDAIRNTILASSRCTPPNPFPVAAIWDETLCREHPDFVPLLQTVDECLQRARALRDLVEAVNARDTFTICRLWDPGLQGVSYMTPGQRTIIRQSLELGALSDLPIVPHRVDPLVFTSSGVEIRWVWPRSYRWLFAIAVRDKRYPQTPFQGHRARQNTLKTADQCRDGVELPFRGDLPHVCVWPAVTLDDVLVYGNKPLRMDSRRLPLTRKEYE